MEKFSEIHRNENGIEILLHEYLPVDQTESHKMIRSFIWFT